MDTSHFTVLAIDDDPTQLELLRVYCSELDYPHTEFIGAATAEEGYKLLKERTVDLVLSDYRLPDHTGLEVLEYIKQYNPLIRVVIMTAFENVSDAVEILQKGGDDYLIKPTRKQDIEHLLVRIFELQSIERENQVVDEEIHSHFEHLPLVYRSEAIQNVLNVVARSARSNATVLITGESGTGKELIARLIHQTSLRSDKPFVTVNIAALPESLMEGELFGHVKGAYTGADQDRMGRFEEADGGTLFIDEIGEVPPPIQVKLLRAIQFGQVQRIGENLTRELDVRIIGATNRDLERMVEEHEFRSDLYWRMNVVHIHIPPLRDRKSDISELSRHFIERFNEKNKRSIQGISREALDRLMQYNFPGNVRELENIIERAIIMARGAQLTRSDLQLPDTGGSGASGGGRDSTDSRAASEGLNGPTDGSYQQQMNAFETRLISTVLDEADGNQSEAARRLQISERRLRSRMEILGIKKP
ncbi:MAG: sigma-54-dependent transcriptional regulator [Sediminispirochaetaceae bacterium]